MPGVITIQMEIVMNKVVLVVLLVLGSFVLSGFGQGAPPAPPATSSPPSAHEGADRVGNTEPYRVRDFGPHEEVRRPKRPEIPGPTAMSPSREQRSRLSPSAEDLSKYADVLRRTHSR